MVGVSFRVLVITIFIVQFVLPFGVICTVTAMTVVELRKSKQNLEAMMDSALPNRDTRPVEKNCARCIVIFFLTWTPYCLYLMIDALGHETGLIIQTFCQVSILLRFVHYITNPWTLLLGSKAFRRESKKIIQTSISSYTTSRRKYRYR